jgi:hypothetical protein
LTDNIERYEAEFGPIGETNTPQPVIQFQLPGGEA